MSKNRILLIAAGVVLAGIIIWFISRGAKEEKKDVLVKPSRGTFEVSVTTTGELRAKNSVDILGPSGAQKAQIYQLKITDLVDEGTVVLKGEYVGELDKSEMMGKLKDVEANMQKNLSELTTQKLDSTLTLSEARESIVTLIYQLEESKLEKEQAKFEAPAVQRQKEIAYEKAARALERAKENYGTKVKQAEAKVKIAESELDKATRKYEEFNEVVGEFTIKAPENGMVIYDRDWDGRKKVVGSTVRSWNPVVATLPDLSVMESVTWVNEVDIQKIKEGQAVKISLDSDPDKVLDGKVTSVANIGEQRPNSDSKVFEVVILITNQDSTLRPAMTTSNVIEVSRVEDVVYVPLECLHSEDSISFVYKKEGGSLVRQEVKVGMINENEAVIQQGLTEEDEIFLSMPEMPEGPEMVKLVGIKP
ncbi:MAG: HlyD family efflux transporter periplasmic adaptor subunit [Bacteroidia bacterium]|nr:HlyD family efflux transporter periplasmic adaptor subunit [Bacteroidia bacterium]